MGNSRFRWKRGILAVALTAVAPGLGQFYNGNTVAAAFISTASMLVIIYSKSPLAILGGGVCFYCVTVAGGVLVAAAMIRAFLVAGRGSEMTPYRSWRYLLPYGAVYLSFSIAMGALSTTENFRVPGNSMAPTIIEGDRIMADTSAFRNGSPRPGDLVIFRYPKDRSVTFIKRIVGLPGDKIEFCGLGLFRNGMEVPSRVVSERDGMKILEETLENASYEILLEGHQAPKNEVSAFIVPADQYFVLGDNRDQSSDSRVWGSVKREDLLGKPAFAWLSWDKERHRNRWERLFKRLE